MDNNQKNKNKPIIKKSIEISKGGLKEEYKHEEDIDEYKSLNTKSNILERVQKQFELMSEIIPKNNVDTRNAVIGKDTIKNLIIKENNIKLMLENLTTNASILQKQKNILISNYNDNYNTSLQDIKIQENIIKNKVNQINILFKRLFHRRRKMEHVPTVWVQ